MSTRKLIGVLAASAALVAVLSVPALADQPHYNNCTEAREAGAAPINQGEPGYRPELDRNNDGVACEDSNSAPSQSGSAGSNDRPADRNEADSNEQAPAQQSGSTGSDTDKEAGSDTDKEERKEAPSPKPVESDLPVTH